MCDVSVRHMLDESDAAYLARLPHVLSCVNRLYLVAQTSAGNWLYGVWAIVG